ncbi:MAG TPA: hypothetical protein V6C58_07110, partial [Allocoleopsis sp.]
IWEAYPSEDYWKWLRPVHVLSVIFDAYTSFLGTAQYIILRDFSNLSITIDLPDVMQKTTFGQQMVILFITILVVISPIILPKIINK